MTINNKVKVCMKSMTLMLVFALALAGGASANPGGAGSSEKREMTCRVEGNNIKQVLVTNHTDRVIAKGTPVKFDNSTGVETTALMPKNLKPGRTAIIYSGVFKGSNCQCQLNQQ